MMEERNLKKKIIVLLVCMALLVGMLSGCTDKKEEEEEPENNAPVASFTSEVNHDITTAGGIVTFTDASTDADEGDTLTYAWVFGDDGTSTVQNPEHTYVENGSYTVTLTVSDGTDTDTYTATVIVGNLAPTADFTYVPTGLSVEFTDESTDPNPDDILTYAWDFGDELGTNTTVGPVTYEYADAASYNVTLTVTDSFGLTSEKIQKITVEAVAT